MSSAFASKEYVDHAESRNPSDFWTGAATKELPLAISAMSLGNEVFEALDDYREDGQPIMADEWEILNNQLLDFFGEKSIAAFERKKKEVTVRRDAESGELSLFKDDRVLELTDPEPARLGDAIKGLLGLPPPDQLRAFKNPWNPLASVVKKDRVRCRCGLPILRRFLIKKKLYLCREEK